MVDSSNDESTPKAIISNSGVEFVDENLLDKIDRVKLSNSLVSSVLKCPARMALDKWILNDLIPPDPTGATILGSAYHKVMELFFYNPPAERNLASLRQAYYDMLLLDEFKPIRESVEAQNWVKTRVNNYWHGVEDPQKVTVAETVDKKGKKKLGLELYLQGNIGDSERVLCGFIDRLCYDDKTGVYTVDDWKTGKKAEEYNPYERFADFSYYRQQVLYSMLLEQQGKKVDKARLIYPLTVWNGVERPHVTVIPVHDANYRQKAVDDVVKADKIVNKSVETNCWQMNPSALCSWCPLVNVCPKAMKISKQNAIESRQNQPTAEFLKTGGIWTKTKLK